MDWFLYDNGLRHERVKKPLQNEMNYVKAIIGIKSVLKLWRMRNLTLEGKIIIFKNLALSKITYLALLIIFPKYIINEIERI